MIPRTKVNYSAGELLRALFASERSTRWRESLRGRLRELFGFEHVLLTPSGRGALYHLLKALPQPKVIVPAYTCKAVVEAARMAGKEVVHAEVEPDGFNLDAALLEPLLDSSCIVIATHQFGIPCEIQAIQALCAKTGAFLVEDAAASFGTRTQGRLTGTLGDAAFFSFDSTKLINVPLKAGFLAVRNGELHARISSLYEGETMAMTLVRKLALLLQGFLLLLLENHHLYRLFHTVNFAWRGRFTADGPELNLQPSPFYLEKVAEWQAFLAVQQLDRLDAIIAQRREVYAAFGNQLRGCDAFALPPADTAREWACIRYPIRVRGDKIAFYEAAVRRDLDFAFSFTFIDCPEQMQHARRLAGSVLDLPFYTKLSSAEFNQTVRVLKELSASA